jgi:hypothetical protein
MEDGRVGYLAAADADLATAGLGYYLHFPKWHLSITVLWLYSMIFYC